MAALFAVSFGMNIFLPKSDDTGIAAASSHTSIENQETEQSPQQSSSVFGGETERFVAHRGYSGYAPENSLAAFELAGKMGFWGIETDISETIDGYFICMHDDDLDRTTDGGGAVGDYTLSQLEAYNIDAGNYVRTTENLKIPTLEEYLNICKTYGCVGIVEIKGIKNYDAFLSVIDSCGMTDRCVITGGNVEDIQEVHARNASIPVMLIGYYPEPYSQCLTQIADIGENRGVLYNYPQVEQYVVETLHNQNVLCAVWTVDDTETAQKYLGYGVDFIVTNEIPARLSYETRERAND